MSTAARRHSAADPRPQGEPEDGCARDPANAPFVLALDDAGERASPAVAGGKAARLAIARARGFPVPDGFAVTTSAFRAWLSAPGLEAALAARLPALAGAGLPRVAEIARELEAVSAAAPFPPDVASAVREALRRLGAPPVAVRSSAPDEDGEARSLAGHFDTFLDVRGEDDVLDRVRRCFASCFTERALAHRARHGDGRPPAMAVLVQRLVAAEVAGILFTREPGPATDPDRMVVEVGAGLGHDVAAGLVTPARYAIDRRTSAASRLAGDGRVELGAPLAALLADLGARVEASFGGPQDIEWAAESGRLWLLQTRPITGAAPGPGPGPAEAGRDLWTAANAQEALERPVTPLTFSYFGPLIERGRRRLARALGVDDPPGEYLRLFDGHVYFNVRYFREFLARVPGIPPNLADELIFGQEPGRGLAFPRPRPSLRLLGVAATVVRTGLTAARRLDLFIAAFRRRVAEMQTVQVKLLEDRFVLTHLARVTRLVERALNAHVLGTAVAGTAHLVLVHALEALGVGRGENVADELVAAASGMETARSNDALYALAETAGRLPAVRALLLEAPPDDAVARLSRVEGGAEFRQALDRFLAEFGHRAAEEAELAAPRWREDPSFILGTIRRALEAGVERSPAAAEAAARTRKAAIARRVERELARRSTLERVVPLRRLAFRALARLAERHAPYRENLRFHALAALQLVREGYLELGRRLAHRQALPGAPDVFYLDVSEVRRALELGRGHADLAALAPLAARRQAELAEAARRRPPRFLGPDGLPVAGPPRPAAVSEDLARHPYLEGVPVSGGLVTGPVRKIDRLEDAHRLRPGEILLARAATPSWTPYFFFARGVILDLGGLLSHSAVIAREYGIPCVVGVKTATEVLRDGDVVTVDAHRGRVYLPGAEPGRTDDRASGPALGRSS